MYNSVYSMTRRIGFTVCRLACILILSSASCTALQAQDKQPIHWYFNYIPLGDKEAKLIFTASLDDGWHIYSQFIEDGGPMPTAFTFLPSDKHSLTGKVIEESIPVKEYDSVFMMDIVWYTNTVVFSQYIQLNAPVTTVKGKVLFMGCNNFMCLPPDEVEFSVEVRAEKNGKDKGR
jgi:hypothetical protein